MYCPNCGKENSDEQRFCRSCGLSLQAISQVLVSELSENELDSNSTKVVKHEQRRLHNPLLYGFLLLLLGMMIIIFGKKIIVEQLIADIGTLIAVLGVALFGYKGVLLMLQPQSSSPSQIKTLPESDPTAKLPPALQPDAPPSVTEHTTRTLEPINNKRKAE